MLSRTIKEVEKAISELDGDIAQLTFNPDDPQSIDQAIQKVNAEIDRRIGIYDQNEVLVSIVEDIKENIRQEIIERAAATRLKGESNNDS